MFPMQDTPTHSMTGELSPSPRAPPLRRIHSGWFQIALLQCFCIGVLCWSFQRHSNDLFVEEDIAKNLHATSQAKVRSHEQRLPRTSADSKKTPKEPAFLESSFVYANQTYKYRYSPQIHTAAFWRRHAPQAVAGEDATPPPPQVAYGVCANAAKPVRRNAIRKSWGKKWRSDRQGDNTTHRSHTTMAPGGVMVFYLVAGDWEPIAAEFHRTGDLLWVDTPEDYRDALTPKTFGFLHFGAMHLVKAAEAAQQTLDYLFKTDDDVYLNTTELQWELVDSQRPDYFGLVREKIAPTRDRLESKWHLSQEDYPEQYFPKYAHGTGYALSIPFAHCAATRAMVQLERPMPWEDVATGMLAQLCRVSLTPSDPYWEHFLPFGSSRSEWEAFPYVRFKDGNVPVKILHKVKPWFFEPLSRQASLVEAREYGGKRRNEAKRKRDHRGQG